MSIYICQVPFNNVQGEYRISPDMQKNMRKSRKIAALQRLKDRLGAGEEGEAAKRAIDRIVGGNR